MGEKYAPLVADGYAPERLRAIIPVGGRATRLLPLTAETSKACLRILNRPLVEFTLYSLASQNVRNYIFGVKGYTNYRDLYDYFQSGIGFSVRYNIKPRIHVKYQPNIEDMGSADSARINMEYYDIQSPLFAVQGDNIFDINVKDLIRFHKEKEAIMTIVLREVQNVEGLGIADIDNNCRIREFVEKPMPKDAPSNLANTGLYLISPQARKIFKEKALRQMMEEKHRLDFGYDFIPYVIKAGYPVYGYTLKGNWFDVGTPKNYLEAMRNMLYGCFSKITDFGGRLNDETPIWVQGESNESEARREEIIQKIKKRKIRIEGAVLIGRHCQIEEGARIVDSCIDNYTKIGKNAVVQNSAIMDRTIIGEEAEVLDSIIGRHATIRSSHSRPTRISAISVIADDVSIDEGSVLATTKIYPHQSLRGEFQNQTVIPS